MIAATTSQTAPHESVRAHPIRWKPEGAAAWSEPDHGFYIELRADEPPESRYLAAWGEGDAESFDALEAAQEWCQELIDGWVRRNALITTGIDALHPDDVAVDRFAAAMKSKLADARAKGRGGWEEPGIQLHLSDLLRGHVEKGDPRDVANFCCFLWNRGEGIAPASAAAAPLPALWKGEAAELRRNAREARAHENASVDDFARADRLDMKADGKHECADDLEAALMQSTQQAGAVPEPTKEMISAGRVAVMALECSGPKWTVRQHYEASGESPAGIPDELLDMTCPMPKAARAELIYRAMLAAAPPGPSGGWRPIGTCPVNTDVLLWNNDTAEKVIGYKPEDAPHPECVIVASTAAYADAWHAMPPDPEAEQEEPA